MNCFIAYFDYLGFKEFIENNNLEVQKMIISSNNIILERAISKHRLKETEFGMVHDLSNAKINCMNFSDTVVLWTNDNSDESMDELIDVSHKFNLYCTTSFPSRGSIVYGEFFTKSYNEINDVGGKFNFNSVFI